MNVRVNISNFPDSGDFVTSSSRAENIDSSFKSDANPIGNLLWQAVMNGRYAKYHPVWDKNDSMVGYLKGGVRELGYTFRCLYSDRSNCFFVSHVPFGAAWQGGSQKSSFISTIEATGKFWLFKQGLKFERTSSINFSYEWVGSELIFRFINDGDSLLCVTKLGFCVINTDQSSLMVKTLFGNDHTHIVTGAELSPNTRLLTVSMSEWSYNDPVAGEDIYQNTLRIYDVKSGELIGTQDLEVAGGTRECAIRFNEDGSIVSISSHDFNKLYKLSTTSG